MSIRNRVVRTVIIEKLTLKSLKQPQASHSFAATEQRLPADPLLSASMPFIRYTALCLLLLSSSISWANEPGLTPGQFSVDQTGGANYSIPIVVPPGTAGMQPNLSLSYNSRRSNGLLGVGWSLGGLSAITRCSATMVQDGFIDGVDFDSNDRFCLDGRRLIEIGTGTDSEGAYTEYRTEIDSFTRVKSYGTAGSGPAKFKAWTKSGQIIEYGYDDVTNYNSRIEAQGKSDVRVWAVSRIQDTVGNYLTVSYTEDTEEYRPDRIDYTGNDGASLSTYASVEFEYDTRSDITPKYLSGSLIKTTQRLTDVKTYVGSTLVRDYQLTYDNQGVAGRTRLLAIQECDAVGQCLPATQLTWQAGESGFASPPYYWEVPGKRQGCEVIPADFNGDGLMDLYYRNESGTCANWDKDWIRLNTGNGFASPPYYWEIPGKRQGCKVIPADFNGDGLTDLYYHNESGT